VRRRSNFCGAARHFERHVFAAHQREITLQRPKIARPVGLRPEWHHAALFVVRLNTPNVSPRALPAAIPGSSAASVCCVNKPW